MQGRIGGVIGARIAPSQGWYFGVWRLGEVYAATTNSYGFVDTSYYVNWPMNEFFPFWSDYTEGEKTIDATETGAATFTVSLFPYAGQSFDVSYLWERSTDSGATWTTVSGSEGSVSLAGYGSVNASLELTGQTSANNGDKYRIVFDPAMKRIIGPTGVVLFT